MTLNDALLVMEQFLTHDSLSSDEREAVTIVIDTLDAVREHRPSQAVLDSLELYRIRRAMQRKSL